MNSKTEKIQWNRRGEYPILQERQTDGVPYLAYTHLEKSGLVRHGFSTRLGGVSEGCCASMNLSVRDGDTQENVTENYRRMAHALGVDPQRLVLSAQTHTTNVRRVTEADAGKGYCRERDYTDVDGLITDVPGLTLVTHYADCVPLFFLDPVHRAIGLSHSGWRGTVGRMGQVTLTAMKEAFGTRPEDVLAAIGPSICRDCYEVSEDVAEAFRSIFPEEVWPEIMDEKGGGKYQLDLWAANRRILLDAGVQEKNLQVTDLCTSCNARWLFSHRASGGHRGTLGAFLGLK
ncbi:MAG: peptidoglycan editing factor PgeF [Lachnospiraceae bacterium]|nr:peptidoglycan editing factor PgeF [Lachnospiraceae bacterium]